ncbi:unnamed protein product [Peronospora farinosa]|uniref:Uncharacterized protein n=1 Tax=Peronospora farinosa TaxID=134698 RepID=A0AAV0THN2_9STRA|nr:unnamed protein product [Peronospora farinosa]
MTLLLEDSALPPAMQRDGVTRSTLAKARDNPLRAGRYICDSKCHAHEWMPLEGVRPHGDDLCQALLCWKSKDFTIVEVEQPDSSVSLRYRARWCLSWVETQQQLMSRALESTR